MGQSVGLHANTARADVAIQLMMWPQNESYSRPSVIGQDASSPVMATWPHDRWPMTDGVSS